MSLSRSLLPYTASLKRDLSHPSPDPKPGPGDCHVSSCAPTPAPCPRSWPPAFLPVTAGAAGRQAGADPRDLGEPRVQEECVWTPEGVEEEARGSPGPAPPSWRLWGV